MFDLTRLVIARQRRVAQSLSEFVKNPKALKGLHADVRKALEHAVETGAALDDAPELPPLLVDNSSDAVFAAFDAWLEATVRGMNDRVVTPLPPDRAAKKAAAATLRARALPRGTRFLALSMPLQYDAMKKVIDALREDDACVAAIKELDAGFWVDHMEAHLAPYGRAVKTLDGRDVDALGEAFHKAFHKLCLATLTHHDGDAGVRKGLLGAYETELEAQREDERAARKRRAAAKKKPAENRDG
jgi:hypothetical protein